MARGQRSCRCGYRSASFVGALMTIGEIIVYGAFLWLAVTIKKVWVDLMDWDVEPEHIWEIR